MVLRIEFTDATAMVGIEAQTDLRRWQWMDMGLWSPLELSRSGDREAVARMSRTAPEWLVLKDPSGGLHRMLLLERPDPMPMPTPGRLRDTEQLDGEDRGALVVIGMIWVLSFVRR